MTSATDLTAKSCAGSVHHRCIVSPARRSSSTTPGRRTLADISVRTSSPASKRRGRWLIFHAETSSGEARSGSLRALRPSGSARTPRWPAAFRGARSRARIPRHRPRVSRSSPTCVAARVARSAAQQERIKRPVVARTPRDRRAPPAPGCRSSSRGKRRADADDAAAAPDAAEVTNDRLDCVGRDSAATARPASASTTGSTSNATNLCSVPASRSVQQRAGLQACRCQSHQN